MAPPPPPYDPYGGYPVPPVPMPAPAPVPGPSSYVPVQVILLKSLLHIVGVSICSWGHTCHTVFFSHQHLPVNLWSIFFLSLLVLYSLLTFTFGTTILQLQSLKLEDLFITIC